MGLIHNLCAATFFFVFAFVSAYKDEDDQYTRVPDRKRGLSHDARESSNSNRDGIANLPGANNVIDQDRNDQRGWLDRDGDGNVEIHEIVFVVVVCIVAGVVPSILLRRPATILDLRNHWKKWRAKRSQIDAELTKLRNEIRAEHEGKAPKLKANPS
mmetsp:Transcript_101097/g.159382  ORF Transcript_101097/g.159382 Transcript_101097/m.159382 type:complete len:157 (+) Transcript_101097:23-493(+)